MLFVEIFMPPKSKIGGHIVFFPVCHSVLLSETLTLLITFEQWVLELWFFTWIFRDNTFPLVSLFFTLYLDLGVWPIFETLNLHYNFCTVKSFEKLVLVCQNGKVFDDVILMRTFLNQLLVANYKLKVL